MSVAENFKKLTENLKTNDDSKIAERCKRITKRINLDFWDSTSEIEHTRYLGSYGRGTDIFGHSDVDMFAQLPWALYNTYNSYTWNGQSSLLQAVRSSLLTTYPLTEIGGDGQVVVVRFQDGIRFEVLPGFSHSDGTITYPDSNNGGSWKLTNPIPEIAAINAANNQYQKKVKHLARMARAWKQKHSVPIKGLLIDTFACNFMNGWAYNDKSYLYYDFMTRDFMKYLSERDSKQGYWLVPGSNQWVTRIGNFETKASHAHNLALEAINNEGNPVKASLKWNAIFGWFYPS